MICPRALAPTNGPPQTAGVSDRDVVEGIRRPGKFDATLSTEGEARQLIGVALPGATELPPATGSPYPRPSPDVQSWFQLHPPEPSVGNDLPHLKYADWTRGKKGRGGTWGHLFFPVTVGQNVA